MKVINNYHKRLAFNIDGKAFGIDINEVKVVDDKLGRELIKNFWIDEVKEEKKPEIKETLEKTEKKEHKGRVSLKAKNSFNSKKF